MLAPDPRASDSVPSACSDVALAKSEISAVQSRFFGTKSDLDPDTMGKSLDCLRPNKK